MKGAKGGNRDRIISWLFSEKNRKIREEREEIEKAEEIKIDEKQKERRKGKKIDETSETITEIKPISNEEVKVVEHEEKIDDEDKTSEEDLDVTLIDIFDTSSDRDKRKDKKPGKEKNEKPPTLFIDEEIVEEIKEQHKNDVEEKHEKEREKVEKPEVVKPHSTDTTQEEIEVTNNIFPEVDEVVIDEETVSNNVEKPELVQISIIEEIDNLLKNDSYELRDIKYQIEVLSQEEKDEVLLENIEKIQKQLEELVKRFEEIKKKYDNAYTNIAIKDIDFINNLDLGFSISDYINSGKNGNLDISSIDEIHEIEQFINIINDIIEIEKQKDIIKESVDDKLVDYSIRDEDFIKLQDQYADVEAINARVDKYNLEINGIIKDMEEKLANSVDITRRIETTTKIVPDINRIVRATVLMASTNLIPPTPAGNLFRTTILLSAAHMMATAFVPQTEEKEIVKTTVIDYSKDILANRDSINGALDSIENAFGEINYMKDIFDKEFSQFKDQIPEYDELVKNIYSIEKELARQQDIAYEYSNKIDEVLNINDQKVKRIEE